MSVNETQVKQYLLEHPELLTENLGLFLASQKVIDFREALLIKAQHDQQNLQQKQQQWVQHLSSNQILLEQFWHSSAMLARANGYQAIISELQSMLVDNLHFPAWVLKLMPAHNKRPVPEVLQMQGEVDKDVALMPYACVHLPKHMQLWLEGDFESHMVVPLVFQQNMMGYCIIASGEAGYFNADSDTTYLTYYAQVLAASLARIMGVTSL